MLVGGRHAVAPQADAGAGAPVLWEGEVRDVYGKGVPAGVVAFLRPPPALLVPNAPLVPLASTTTDRSGHFVLRSTPTAAFNAITDESGWGTLLLATFGAGDVELVVDSVAWKDGRWITSPVDMATPESKASKPALLAERPAMVTLAKQPMKAGTPPPNAGSCWARERPRGMGEKWVPIGELHLNRDWGGQFKFTNTRTTSFQIGLSENAGPFKVGGSVSWSKSSETGGGKHPIGPGEGVRMYALDARLEFMRFEWACNKEYPERYEASTLEPVDWTTDLRERTDAPAPGCNPKFTGQALPDGYYNRAESSSLTLSGAISIAGFTGGMTSAISDSVFYQWDNYTPRHRNVCGESAKPDADTRISSLP